MDTKFRELVKNTRTQMDKEVKFLIDHGIDPSAKYSNIPMYDPSTKGLVILRGVSKNSPYFKNGEKVSPEDKVLIQKVEEYRVATTPEQNGNYYVKDYAKDKIEITVDEYLNTIYNNPRNEETKAFLNLNDLDTEDKINTANTTYSDKKAVSIQNKNYDFNEWIKKYADEFDLDDLTEAQKLAALKELYKKNQEGFKIQDLAKFNIIWKIRHQRVFNIAAQAIEKLTDDKDERQKLRADLSKNQKIWFKQGLNTTAELITVLQEWLSNLNTTKESVLTEFYPTNSAEKSPVVKDMYEVKQALIKLFGIDADKFITVPIIKKGISTQDKYGNTKIEKPEQRFTVLSFPNQNELLRLFELLDKQDKTSDEIKELGKLSNYTQVRVKDVDTNESFLMNLKELGELINKPENQNTELDTVDYRLQSGNEFKTLNPGNGKFVDIPEEIIIEMLKVVNTENDEWEDINLVDYYNDAKRTNTTNPLLTKALNSYNDDTNQQYVIRAFSTKDGLKFKGFIPNYEHQHSRPAMSGKDKYREILK